MSVKKTGFEQVEAFHQAFSHPVNKQLTVPNEQTVKLRLALILEEFIELYEANTKAGAQKATEVGNLLKLAFNGLPDLTENDLDVDLVEVADALTDINYVVYGAGHCYGIDLDETMKEVQRSNMSKLGADGQPIMNEHGKIMKGPNYFKPDLAKVIGADTN